MESDDVGSRIADFGLEKMNGIIFLVNIQNPLSQIRNRGTPILQYSNTPVWFCRISEFINNLIPRSNSYILE